MARRGVAGVDDTRKGQLTAISTAERLENKGLLSSKKGEAVSERGGKAKRYFSVTPLGMSALNVTKKQLETLWSQASVNFSIQGGRKT